MPLRFRNIFDEPPSVLDRQINPYAGYLIDSRANAELGLLFGAALKGKKGNWRDFLCARSTELSVESKLVLEIGVHKGLVLREMAKNHRNYGFIGMDITFKRVYLSASKAQIAGLKNVSTIYGDAKFLPELFADGELDGIIMFFPDPWNKKKSQISNRLITEDFCRKLYASLKDDGGFFWLKTDDLNYFKESSNLLEKQGFKYSQAQEPSIFTQAYQSTFEKNFKRQQINTYAGVWMKTLPLMGNGACDKIVSEANCPNLKRENE